MYTRLEQFLKNHRIKPAHLARESGYSRQHLLRIRMGRMEPTRRCIAAIVAACRHLAKEPVLANDLFDLGEEERQPKIADI
jgi:predicted transcriptional regulator